MPAQSTTPHHPNDPYHRVVKALPMTHDGGFFVKPDTISEAEQAHQTPSLGLNSRNVKRPRNGRKAAKLGLGVTGGAVDGAQGTTEVTIGAQKATCKTRRAMQRAKTRHNRARKAAERQAVITALRERGYNVR